MKKDLKFNKYVQVVEAVEFEDGMEDGSYTRYSSREEDEKFEAGEIDSISTWGIKNEDDDVEHKVPYIIDQDGRELLCGINYMIVKIDGKMRAVPKVEFDKIYVSLPTDEEVDKAGEAELCRTESTDWSDLLGIFENATKWYKEKLGL